MPPIPGFFQDKDKSSARPEPATDLQWADQLAQAVRQKKRVTRPISLKAWSAPFQKMRIVDKLPEDKISKVLKWYCSHLGEEYVPEAYSAKGFREKFGSIVRAMERRGETAEEVTVSKEAKEIAERLTAKGPFGMVEDQLPSMVQRSLNNYRDFLTKVKELRDHLTEEKVCIEKGKGVVTYHFNLLKRFCEYILNKYGFPLHFVENWFLALAWRDQLGPGELQSKEIKVDSVQLKWLVSRWACDYGVPGLGNELMTRISNNEDSEAQQQ